MYTVFGTFGVTGGAHRLWTHRAYQANLPFRILLMLGQTSAVQNHIYEWVTSHSSAIVIEGTSSYNRKNVLDDRIKIKNNFYISMSVYML